MEAVRLWIFGQVFEVLAFAQRVQVIDSDGGMLAVAPEGPVQILLQLHQHLDRIVIEGDALDDRARDVRPPALAPPHRIVDAHRSRRSADFVRNRARLDGEPAANGTRKPRWVEHVRPDGQEFHPHDFERLEITDRVGTPAQFRIALVTDQGHVLLTRQLHDEPARRALLALEDGEAFHITT